MELLPDIGLGTGGAEYLAGEECVDVVATALELGYRHVDTAQSYGNEREVGEGVARADVPREDVVVATKVAKTNLAYDDVIDTGRASADRLGTGIDLLYAHFPTETYEATETIPALCELVDEGVADHIGLSNFAPVELEEAMEIADRPIVAHQVEMHPLYRREELVEGAREQNLALVVYSPLAQGAIFGVPELEEVAAKHDTDEAAVTLAWLAGKDPVTPIPKTTSEQHLRANLEAAALELDAEDVALIESIDREQPVYGH